MRMYKICIAQQNDIDKILKGLKMLYCFSILRRMRLDRLKNIPKLVNFEVIIK